MEARDEGGRAEHRSDREDVLGRRNFVRHRRRGPRAEEGVDAEGDDCEEPVPAHVLLMLPLLQAVVLHQLSGALLLAELVHRAVHDALPRNRAPRVRLDREEQQPRRRFLTLGTTERTRHEVLPHADLAGPAGHDRVLGQLVQTFVDSQHCSPLSGRETNRNETSVNVYYYSIKL